MVIESRQTPGELLAAISNMVVGVYADCLGRGPTRARSFIDQDVVLCLLEDTLTRPEQHLQKTGRSERLLDLRVTLQEAMQESLVAGMERLSNRKVRALISGSQLNPDIASEVFVLGATLEPGDSDQQDGSGPLLGSAKLNGLFDEEPS